jgi:hypothetical protein
MDWRRDRGIKRRITAAHFAEHKTLETFDCKFNKTINRTQYEPLATGDFIRRRTNVVLVGQAFDPAGSPASRLYPCASSSRNARPRK